MVPRLLSKKLERLLILCFLLPDIINCGHLELNPPHERAIRLAGDEHSFFISCVPYSDSAPVGDSRVRARELRWQKRRKPPLDDGWVTMGSQPHERVHVEQSADGRGLDLVFRSIQVDDGGEYSCEAILDNKKETKKFHLNIIEPISFGNTPQIQSVEEGIGEFTLGCQVTGNPIPVISWNVRGQIIRGGGKKYAVTDQGLTIYNVTKADQGSYKCKATQMEDGVSDFKDLVIQLKVQHEPEWPAEQRGEFYGFISGTTNLTCEANAEPPAHFSWLDRNNNEIQLGRIINEKHKSTLMLEVTHDALFGVYTCIAKNKMGSLRKAVILSEGAKPGIPTIKVDKLEHSSVDLTIQEHKAEMYLDINGFRLEYKEKNDDWTSAKVILLNKTDSRHYTIDSLLPKTFYFIRARAQNLAGLSDPSNTIYLQTSAPHAVEELIGSASVASGTRNTCRTVISASSMLILALAIRTQILCYIS